MSNLSFEQYAAVRLMGAAKYSPDGTRIAYIANTTGYANLWLMPDGGGFPRQLTAFSKRRVTDFSWSPDGTKIAFTCDLNGDEMHQVFVVDAAGGWPRQLTDNPSVQYTVSDWTPDGKHIVITGNDREPSEMDPQLLDAKTGEAARLLTGGILYGTALSPDGRNLIIVDFRSNTDQNLYVLDLESGEKTLVTPHEGEAIFQPTHWEKDNRGFYLLTNQGREYTGLAFYTLASGKWGYSHAPEHDVEAFDLAEDGRTTLAVINVDGASRLQAYDLEKGSELEAPDLPLGVVSSISLHPSERRAVIVFARATEASNIYEVDLQANTVRPLEQSMLGGVPEEALIEPELVSYPSSDRDIPAWLFRPQGPGAFPVVLSIHGGPEAQERPLYMYSGLYQYLLSRGIGVLAPNIRGSTGYGASYQKLIHRDWGGAELEDIRHTAEYLRGLDWVDSERLAVFGGSFGGFAALSAAGRLPDLWSVVVDVVGPSNLITFVESVPPHWKAMLKEWVGDAVEDREMLVERSPITYVDDIRAPLLVIQGANDQRVVKAESDQMVERLRSLGREVEYYVDDESGHGPSSREAGLYWWKMVGEYLVERLSDSRTERREKALH
ncbi:MAG: S9 family peptidase [Trueperaceae bacterium]